VNDQVKYSLAGFCMGVAELIPGISGSTVAVIFKIYPNLMSILSQLRPKNFSLNLSIISQKFQLRVSLPLIFSMIAAIILCSNLISIMINNYEELFLSLLGWLMMFLSIYVADFFKALLKRLNLLIFLILGIVTLGSAVNSFKKHETTINPIAIKKASSLVISGAFKYSRNPMYLGMVFFLLAVTAKFNVLGGILITLLFALFITKFQIIPEEEAMHEIFGEEFDSYKQKTRRWL